MKNVPWTKRWPGKTAIKASLLTEAGSLLGIETHFELPIFKTVLSLLMLSVVEIPANSRLLAFCLEVETECQRLQDAYAEKKKKA